MDGRKNGWTDGQMNKLTDGLMDGWTDRPTNKAGCMRLKIQLTSLNCIGGVGQPLESGQSKVDDDKLTQTDEQADR